MMKPHPAGERFEFLRIQVTSVSKCTIRIYKEYQPCSFDKHIIHVHFWNDVKLQGRFNLIWCVTTDGLLNLLDLHRATIRCSITAMQSHRSLVINKRGDLTDSFLSEQSVRDLLLLDRLVLSWLSDMSHCLKRYQRHKELFIRVIRTFNNLNNVTIRKMRRENYLIVKLICYTVSTLLWLSEWGFFEQYFWLFNWTLVLISAVSISFQYSWMLQSIYGISINLLLLGLIQAKTTANETEASHKNRLSWMQWEYF